MQRACHGDGDLDFENVLWDGEKITALLDFEYARPGPPDLELDVFLRFCAFPFLHVAEDYEQVTLPGDYAEVPGWLAQDHPELFAHPRLRDRLRVYSIAYDLRELLMDPPDRPVELLSHLHPYHRLADTVEVVHDAAGFHLRGVVTDLAEFCPAGLGERLEHELGTTVETGWARFPEEGMTLELLLERATADLHATDAAATSPEAVSRQAVAPDYALAATGA